MRGSSFQFNFLSKFCEVLIVGVNRKKLNLSVILIILMYYVYLKKKLFKKKIIALHSDDSMGSQYPFVLKSVQRCGIACGNKCPWFRFCKGCLIPCNDDPWMQNSEFIAIDWDPTALHLRYQPSVEWVSNNNSDTFFVIFLS